MPEGDSIAKAARRLAPALTGRSLVRFEARRLAASHPRVGTVVEAVEAQGKHLLIHFADGRSLRTHMRMTGSWQLYQRGERWSKPAHLARVVIEVDSGAVAVCFSAPDIELYHRGLVPAALRRLGPDLCRLDTGIDEVVTAVLEGLPAVVAADCGSGAARLVADILLDQQVAAGIGNVYKSEVCFACRVDPARPAADVDLDTWATLYRCAAGQLRANVGPGRRTTWGTGLAVYRRRGRPCPRCGTAIRMTRNGDPPRSTYWCPQCQT